MLQGTTTEKPPNVSAKECCLPHARPCCKRRRYLNKTDLPSRVGKLNPGWNQDSSEQTLYRQFLKAVELTGGEFQVRSGSK